MGLPSVRKISNFKETVGTRKPHDSVCEIPSPKNAKKIRDLLYQRELDGQLNSFRRSVRQTFALNLTIVLLFFLYHIDLPFYYLEIFVLLILNRRGARTIASGALGVSSSVVNYFPRILLRITFYSRALSNSNLLTPHVPCLTTYVPFSINDLRHCPKHPQLWWFNIQDWSLIDQ